MTIHFDGLPRRVWLDAAKLQELKDAGRDVSDIGSMRLCYVNGKLDQRATRIMLKRRQGKPLTEQD